MANLSHVPLPSADLRPMQFEGVWDLFEGLLTLVRFIHRDQQFTLHWWMWLLIYSVIVPAWYTRTAKCCFLRVIDSILYWLKWADKNHPLAELELLFCVPAPSRGSRRQTVVQSGGKKSRFDSFCIAVADREESICFPTPSPIPLCTHAALCCLTG